MHAVDMVRRADGSMCVLSDRTQAPTGAGYVLENRTVMSRVFPSIYRESHVHRIASFYQRLRLKLTSLSPSDDLPCIALLTHGGSDETRFEYAYLANYLGLPLVQSGDLVVRNGFLWMKSLDGLTRVDVLLRRVDDLLCDPVELRSDSRMGVPGLLEVARNGRVVIANPLGSGVLENPILLKYLPEISKCLLGREPRLDSVKTYWCGDERRPAVCHRQYPPADRQAGLPWQRADQRLGRRPQQGTAGPPAGRHSQQPPPVRRPGSPGKSPYTDICRTGCWSPGPPSCAPIRLPLTAPTW